MVAYTGTVVQEGRWAPGATYRALGRYTLTTTVTGSDTITWTNLLPVNEYQVLGFSLYGGELDTNATPTGTITVGDGTTATGYLTSKVPGDATGQMQFLGDGAFLGATGSSSPSGRNVVLTTGGTYSTGATNATVYVTVDYYCIEA
jgi:hypothetical protein